MITISKYCVELKNFSDNMKEESIDDIFKELDLIEENFEKNGNNFPLNDDKHGFRQSSHYLAKDDESIIAENMGESSRNPMNRLTSDFFFDTANEIQRDEDYIHIRGLLLPNIYDFDEYDNWLLEDKARLKSDFSSISLKYKYARRTGNETFSDLIEEFDSSKEEPLFDNDYFPYKQMVEVYLRYSKPKEGLEIILDFFDSQTYCCEAIFEYFKFCINLFSRRLGISMTNEIHDLVRRYGMNREDYKSEDSFPIADRIYKEGHRVSLISEEKYEFNQALVLLLFKAINVRWYCGYEYTVKFHVNLMDCEILYFKYLAYVSLGIIAKRMNNSDKFQKYLSKAMEDKDLNGNMLTDDFERIYSCKQIELDYLNNDDEMTNEEKFDELFSGDYRR